MFTGHFLKNEGSFHAEISWRWPSGEVLGESSSEKCRCGSAIKGSKTQNQNRTWRFLSSQCSHHVCAFVAKIAGWKKGHLTAALRIVWPAVDQLECLHQMRKGFSALSCYFLTFQRQFARTAIKCHSDSAQLSTPHSCVIPKVHAERSAAKNGNKGC